MNIGDFMNKLLDLAKIYKYASIIAPRFNENKDSFEKEYLALASNINKIKSDKDYFLAVSKLINTLNDGHTLVAVPKELAERIGYLPFEFICVEGKYYIKSATKNLKSCILKEIKSINNVPFSELLYKCFAHTHNVNGYAYWSRIESILPFFLKKKGNVIEFKDNSTQSFNLLKSKEEFAYFSPIKSSDKFKSNSSSNSISIVFLHRIFFSILILQLKITNDQYVGCDVFLFLKKKKVG